MRRDSPPGPAGYSLTGMFAAARPVVRVDGPGRHPMRRGRALAAVLAAALALAMGVAPGAGAQDPGRWLLTGASWVPITYWQGLTSDPAESNLFFVGVFQGLWRTTPQLHQTAGVPTEIPAGVRAGGGLQPHR